MFRDLSEIDRREGGNFEFEVGNGVTNPSRGNEISLLPWAWHSKPPIISHGLV